MLEMFRSPQGGFVDGVKPSVIVRICDAIIAWTILGLAVLVPLFFLPWTIEVSELNKQLIIVVGAAIAGMAWLGKMLAERKLEYRRSIVNVMVVLFLAVYGISAWLSQSRYLSVVGDFGQENAGFLTVASFAVLYFVVANSLRTTKQIWRMLNAIVFSGLIAAVYALLQGFGMYVLPFDFAKGAAFNTVGTVASLGIFLSAVITLAGGMLLAGHGHDARTKKPMVILSKLFLVLTSVVSLAVIVVVDYWPVTLSLLVASAILLTFAFVHAKNVRGNGAILLPICAFIACILLLLFRMPFSLGYPAEIMPSMKATTDITMNTLRTSPFFGSGPGTFIFDYSKFHAAEVNDTAFWNTRFDRGATRFLTLLATTGLLGTLSWLLVAVFLLISAVRKLFRADEDTWHVLIGVFAAWVVLLISKFTYSSTITLEFVTWMLVAILVVVHRKDFVSVKFDQSPRAAMSVSFVFILSLVLALSGIFVETQRYVAEIKYADAIRIDRAGGKVDDVIDALTKASQYNLDNDVYRRNLASALLTKANTEYGTEVKLDRNKNESDADYNKRVDVAKNDKIAKVAQLTADAVNVAKNATDINDKNVANWSVLATVYESLMGVTDGADDWAVKSFQKSIELEPSNPQLHTELGKVYMYQSDVARQDVSSKDEKIKADAQAKSDKLIGLAVDELNKAVTLKPDYAPARYNLSLALDRQGKLKDAITKMEDTIRLNPKDIGVGFQLSLMYYRDGRKDDAIRLLESVVRLSPQYANARWYLASMYEEKGNLDAAIEQITEVQKSNPDSDLVKQKLIDLAAKKAAVPGTLPPPVDTQATNQNQPDVKASAVRPPAPAKKK